MTASLAGWARDSARDLAAACRGTLSVLGCRVVCGALPTFPTAIALTSTAGVPVLAVIHRLTSHSGCCSRARLRLAEAAARWRSILLLTALLLAAASLVGMPIGPAGVRATPAAASATYAVGRLAHSDAHSVVVGSTAAGPAVADVGAGVVGRGGVFTAMLSELPHATLDNSVPGRCVGGRQQVLPGGLPAIRSKTIDSCRTVRLDMAVHWAAAQRLVHDVRGSPDLSLPPAVATTRGVITDCRAIGQAATGASVVLRLVLIGAAVIGVRNSAPAPRPLVRRCAATAQRER